MIFNKHFFLSTSSNMESIIFKYLLATIFIAKGLLFQSFKNMYIAMFCKNLTKVCK
jgi:hypothetical protein